LDAGFAIGFGAGMKKALAELSERIGSLSPREREIMIHLARGRLSKQIAGHIGIAEATVEATVKVHHSRRCGR
jgi:FixJ family two-component response regulator